jgi:ABC-type lipoprotein release transport system permease subunit
MSISTPLLWALAVVAGVLLVLLALGKVPLAYNLRNLVVRWRITALTALAFTLVVGLLTVMLAFVNGMSRVTEQTGQPGNVLVLSAGATDEVMSHLSVAVSGEVATHPGIVRDEHHRPLCSREVYVAVMQPVPGGPDERLRRRLVHLRGIEDPEIAVRVHAVELLPGGTWFSPVGVRDLPGRADGGPSPRAVEAVLGEAVAREWGLDVGDVFDLGPRPWVVVGVMQATGSAFGSEVWAKQQLVGQTFGKEHVYSSLALRTADAASARRVADDLTRHFKKAALQALPEREYYAQLAATNRQFLGAIYVVAVVMAVGGVFGVMNTMFAAISQRTADIGVLRILGFARWQILVSFLIEALVIALAGGLLGEALGCLAHGRTVTSLFGNRTGKSLVFALVVDGDTLAVGLLFTLSMGGLGGLLPSLSAIRVKPLKALR